MEQREARRARDAERARARRAAEDTPTRTHVWPATPSDNESDELLGLLRKDCVIETRDDCNEQPRTHQPVFDDVVVTQHVRLRPELESGHRIELQGKSTPSHRFLPFPTSLQAIPATSFSPPARRFFWPESTFFLYQPPSNSRYFFFSLNGADARGTTGTECRASPSSKGRRRYTYSKRTFGPQRRATTNPTSCSDYSGKIA